MRTPGLGLRRRNSTSGVLPIAWTMSPYLPPQGRVSSPGSSTSESVVRCRAGLEGDVLLTEPGLLRQDGVLVRVGGRAAAQEAQRLVPGRPHLVGGGCPGAAPPGGGAPGGGLGWGGGPGARPAISRICEPSSVLNGSTSWTL